MENTTDVMTRVLLFDGQAYAVGISAKNTVQRAKEIHNLHSTTAAALGRIMMAALLCASDIKADDGDASTSFDGGGPVGRVIAVATPAGTVRVAFTGESADMEPRGDGKLNVAGVLGREGKLTVIKDNGTGEPYIGQVEIQSGEVAEDIAFYYALSEQRPCLFFLGVVIDTDQSVKGAGGLAVFPLPDCESYVLDALETRIAVASQLSAMLSGGTPLADCLEVIFNGMNMKVTGEIPVAYQCNCSSEKMGKALVSMGKKELKKLIEEDGKAELICHFCRNNYTFDKEELAVLLERASE
jgi:molecular chaperone Hsp33